MADNMVERNAGGFWKALVIEWRRQRTMCQNIFMAEPVEFFGCHPGYDMRCDHIEHFCGQSSGRAHAGKAVFRVTHHWFASHCPACCSLSVINLGKAFKAKHRSCQAPEPLKW